MNKLNILAPLSQIEEVKTFYELGVKEIYCGYIPDYWISAFNHKTDKDYNYFQVGINKRDIRTNNLETLEELESLVKACNSYNMELFLTVNAAFYPNMAYKQLVRFFDEITGINVENVIINDVGLIKFVAENYKELKITVSCLTQVTNCYSVIFLEQFHPRRIVFPRHITLKEVTRIVSEFPQIEFEVFLISGKCIYDDGYCRCHHDLGPVCQDNYKNAYYQYEKKTLSLDDIMDFEKNELAVAMWIQEKRLNHSESVVMYNLGCSICSLAEMLKYPNISSVKLVGRGQRTDIKTSMIQLAADAIKLVENGADSEQLREYVKHCFKDNREICVTNLHCVMRGE